MKDNIKELYEQVKDKKSFITLLSNEYGRTGESIRTNWLSTGSIPDDYVKRVHELLINTLKIQIESTKNMIE